MLDPQVSLIRLLIGDNDRAAPTYSDAQLRSLVTLRAIVPQRGFTISEALKLAGVAAFHRYPSDVSGGPFTGPF